MRYTGTRYEFDPAELRAALSKSTSKILILNSPQNPTGKVFSLEEMQEISRILDDNPHVLVIHDSVYDFLAYDDHRHYSFASLPKNWERTVTVYSGGKLANATGWKVGWMIAPRNIVELVEVVHFPLFMGFNYPCQAAFGKAFKQFKEQEYSEQVD